MTHIICFGDSITRGENDAVGGGWVDRLKTYCIQKFLETKNNEVCVFNMGIGGENSNGLKKRFSQELSSRLLADGKNIVTIGYGANDLALLNKGNTVSLEQFYSNLIFCIDFAVKNNAEIYLLNIIPISEKVNLRPNEFGKIRDTADIIRYNERILAISKEKKIKHIDLFQHFNKEKESLFTYDGVHPNAKGHERIYEKIKNVLYYSK